MHQTPALLERPAADRSPRDHARHKPDDPPRTQHDHHLRDDWHPRFGPGGIQGACQGRCRQGDRRWTGHRLHRHHRRPSDHRLGRSHEIEARTGMTPEKRVLALPCWRGLKSIAPLTGGVSNASFVVVDETGKYVARVGEDYPFHHVFRARELAVTRAAHAVGLSPPVVTTSLEPWSSPSSMRRPTPKPTSAPTRCA